MKFVWIYSVTMRHTWVFFGKTGNLVIYKAQATLFEIGVDDDPLGGWD